MRHALVTGGGGFVGRRLCERLREADVRVTALHRRARAGAWHAQVCVDLATEPVPARALAGVDTVFHLAGHAHAEDGDDAEARHQAVSVDGTRRLLTALEPGVRRLVFASSVKAMGESTPREGLDERAPCAPGSAYGRARLAAERLVLAAGDAGRHVTVLRLPLVYGPGVGGNLERLMRAVRARRMPLLPAFDNRRSMIHVDDVARAAVVVAAHPRARGATYLLSDGDGYASDEVVRAMYAAIRVRPPPRIPRWLLALAARAGDRLERIARVRAPFDSARLEKLAASARYHGERIRADTGFAPRHTLFDALPEMFARLDRAP